MRYFLFPIFLLLSLVAHANEENPFINFEWKEFASIPPSKGNAVQPGLAGAFTGVHDNALIVAGGANFPNGGVWEGGTKIYHNDIYILEKAGDDDYRWFEEKRFSLPQKAAYGLSIATEKGLVCIGGMNGSDYLNAVFLLKWDDNKKEIEIQNLPSLPRPFANMSGGKIRYRSRLAGIARLGWFTSHPCCRRGTK